MDNQLKILSKSFEDKKVRTTWNKDEDKYYISVVDIVSILMDNSYQEARNNWKVIKYRLKKEGNESVTNCNQLKMKSTDGKYYNTDVVDIEGCSELLNQFHLRKLNQLNNGLPI